MWLCGQRHAASNPDTAETIDRIDLRGDDTPRVRVQCQPAFGSRRDDLALDADRNAEALVDLGSDERRPVLVSQLRSFQHRLPTAQRFGASTDDVLAELNRGVVRYDLLSRRDLDPSKIFDPAFPGLGRAGDCLVDADDLDEQAVEALVVDTLDLLLDELSRWINRIGATLRQRSIVLTGDHIRSYVNRMILRASGILDREVVRVLISTVCGVDVLDPVRVNRLLKDQLEVWVANTVGVGCSVGLRGIVWKPSVLLLNQHQIRDVRRRIRYDDVVRTRLSWLPHHKQPAYTCT